MNNKTISENEFFNSLLKKENRKVLIVAIGTILIIAVMLIIACVSCVSDKIPAYAEESTSDDISVTVEASTVELPSKEYKTDETNNYRVNLPEGDELNIRLAPSSADDSKVIASVPSGTVIRIQFIYENWGFTEYGETAGWVSMEYLSKEN